MAFGEDKSWEFSGRWNLGSGLPFTQTQGFYQPVDAGQGVGSDYLTTNPDYLGTYYAGLNEGRLPTYHRLDLNVRMSLYRRLSDLQDKDEIESFAAELIDRFGEIPEEVENLLKIVEIKQLCKRAGIDKIDAGPKGAVISFYKNTPPNVEGLMHWMQEKGGSVKLRPDQKLVVMRGWDTLPKRVQGSKNIATTLAKIAE